MSDGDKKGSNIPSTDVIVKTRPKTKTPSMYKVLMLNDDYTPMEFVVLVLEKFFGKNRSFFSEVVLVDLFGSGTLMTGFITDDHDEFLTVFVPTGPNPTSGNIYHLKKDKVLRTGATVDSGMKSIISCGAGSAEIFEDRIDPGHSSES